MMQQFFQIIFVTLVGMAIFLIIWYFAWVLNKARKMQKQKDTEGKGGIDPFGAVGFIGFMIFLLWFLMMSGGG
jgi:hypothetical protein